MAPKHAPDMQKFERCTEELDLLMKEILETREKLELVLDGLESSSAPDMFDDIKERASLGERLRDSEVEMLHASDLITSESIRSHSRTALHYLDDAIGAIGPIWHASMTAMHGAGPRPIWID